MAGDKFDFRVASSLIQAVDAAANTLEIKNDQMEKSFKNLREGFKDRGYETFALDMSAASNAIKNVTVQMRIVTKHIMEYAEKLKNL